MKLAVLTSSRADFGIYLQLLKLLENSEKFELTIIAFGTHVSKFHGETISEIIKSGFRRINKISSLLTDDSPLGIASSYALTALKFSEYWASNTYDLILCLGDRFEIQAAVQSGIPFGNRYAHFHGGETTLGAMDNIYRHQISLASTIHFTSTEAYSKRLSEILGTSENIYNIGSLSLDNIQQLDLPSFQSLKSQFQIPDNYILCTFHPETVRFEQNQLFVKEMCKALEILSEQNNIVITLPNADTMGTLYRESLNELKLKLGAKLSLIENFGKLNYFSAMKNASVILGNSSSGIIESASFKKYVVNVGNRQKGRMQNPNVLNASFKSEVIINQTRKAIDFGDYEGGNIYVKGNAAESAYKILENLKL